MSEHQALGEQELETCETCNLEPLPQSSQHLPFLLLQFLLLFINIKFALMTVLIGYAFSRTIWICPLCKRDVPVKNAPQNTSNHIIVRIGDCMMLISKNKFRFVAVLLIAALIYAFTLEPTHKPKVPIEKSWRSLVGNCGYEAHMENSFRANLFYEQYQGEEWEIQGIFLSRDNPGKHGDVYVKVKMDPSQFADPNTEDFRVFIKKPNIDLERGDKILIKGKWRGRLQHTLVFAGRSIETLGEKADPENVHTFSNSLRRAP